MSGVFTGVPFRQFVLKVHSRCNLACTYCYVYTGADKSWRSRPARVPDRVVAAAAERIAEHAAVHRLPAVHINLHGGEPLLTGTRPLVGYVTAVRQAVSSVCEQICRVEATVQTNGTLLTEPAIRELAEADIRIGVSLDGGTPALNRRRVGHNGRPGWPAAVQGLRLLARHAESYAGILCTIDLESDPIEVYESLAALRPPAMDLLLPHATWASPPPGKAPGRHPARGGPAPYGEWLIKVFDRWFDGERSGLRIRLFTEIIGLLLGLDSSTEAVGNSPVVAVVVETDGAIEQVDSLKTAYEGAPVTGLDIFRNSFDEALRHPGVAARQSGAEGLGEICRSCSVATVCGGGNYAHRYWPDSGFRSPSVYCADLELLVRHIAGRLKSHRERQHGRDA